MKKALKYIIPAAALLLTAGLSSCVDDLDVTPRDPNISIEYDAEGLFNKCYAGFALEGNNGGGSTDIVASDAGTTGLIRQMWNTNELPTDEAICGWGDTGISEFVFNTFDATHPMVAMYYNRLTVGIDYCNQYINEQSGYNKTMTAEVRLLRAIEYYLLMDAFGNVPFATTLTKPTQMPRAEMYAWLVNEIQEIEPDLSDAKAKKSSDIGYGRLDKAAAWMLLMRLYLNAEVYTGTPQWENAAKYARQLINSDYRLQMNPVITQVTKTDANGNPMRDEDGNPITTEYKFSAYQSLFMGDNGETDAAYEAIFPVMADGITTQQYGASCYLVQSTFNDAMMCNPYDKSSVNGLTSPWAGNRARADLVKKFFPQADAPNVPSYTMVERAKDDRAIFWGLDATIFATDPSTFTTGFGICKFTNFKTDGSKGHNITFPDTDFFFFRLAEAYLTLAECDARQHGGSTTSEGTNALNTLRKRANASQRTNSNYSLNDILDEWSREFYFEGRRRVDLIRFNKFGGNNGYNWEWKGGVYEGRDFDKYRNVYAIPSKELTANKNLRQNEGYK